ncbi:flagellar hook-length control protein FliK [Jeongeupia naejangsanensis]|uniref:Flagellar hook-length control protein FliK n=1 Tax=Jeongeupia naejangsanensis TaxID=613195 RepID=A0ABS2BI04_9NEIS|nr:flagellar hook-length control protein FliK [Jeongeupia naejangsanensis]MBM3114713.1 flagellar hook-length control protein FliK [Jeongeupia naejangsanensis]
MMPLSALLSNALSGKPPVAKPDAPAPAAPVEDAVSAVFGLALAGLGLQQGQPADSGMPEGDKGDALQTDQPLAGQGLLAALGSMNPPLPALDEATKPDVPAGSALLGAAMMQAPVLPASLSPMVMSASSGRAMQPAAPGVVQQAGQPSPFVAETVAGDAAARDQAAIRTAGAVDRPQAAAGIAAAFSGIADDVKERPAAAMPSLQPATGVAGASDTAAVHAPAAPKAAVQTQQAGQQLLAALGDRISVQTRHGIENTTIRLDPPLLGSIEIAIRREGGALQVRLSASNAEVVQQLHGISDNLRQDLGSRQYTQVAVTVADGGRGSDRNDGRSQRDDAPWQQRPGRALAEAGDDERSAAFRLG